MRPEDDGRGEDVDERHGWHLPRVTQPLGTGATSTKLANESGSPGSLKPRTRKRTRPFGKPSDAASLAGASSGAENRSRLTARGPKSDAGTLTCRNRIRFPAGVASR